MSDLSLIAFILVGGVAVWLSARAAQRRMRGRIEKRAARTAEQFGKDFFPPETAPIASKVREILARHLTTDLSRLSPEDSFVDLEIAEMDSMATVDFVLDLEREFSVSITNRDAARLKTFRDVVNYISSAAANKT